VEIYILIALAVGGIWLMSNRTKKQQKAAIEFRNNLVVGDEVMTASGLLGTVVDVEDDVITLESSPGSSTRWIRAAISKKIEPPVDEIDDDVEDEDEDETYDDAVSDADRIEHANDTVIDVPDDLSSLPPARKDGEQDTK
jgi:preprotein translocase subunit YajC